MRLIDADELEPDTDYDDGEYFAYSKAQIENAPTIEPEPKWIPTSQKSHPDNAIRVQIQMGNGWIITGYYKDGYWYSVPECDTPLEDDWIVAWRDLGEPYREEGDE